MSEDQAGKSGSKTRQGDVKAEGYGFTDQELAEWPLVYRDGLFAGKTVLVSGAGSGLGLSMVYGFALQSGGLNVAPHEGVRDGLLLDRRGCRVARVLDGPEDFGA